MKTFKIQNTYCIYNISIKSYGVQSEECCSARVCFKVPQDYIHIPSKLSRTIFLTLRLSKLTPSAVVAWSEELFWFSKTTESLIMLAEQPSFFKCRSELAINLYNITKVNLIALIGQLATTICPWVHAKKLSYRGKLQANSTNLRLLTVKGTEEMHK